MVTAWLGHMGRAWTGEPSDIAAALQHVHQAIQYLLRVSLLQAQVKESVVGRKPWEIKLACHRPLMFHMRTFPPCCGRYAARDS